MITLNFDEVLKRVYNAKKGVEVRYGLGQGFEYCKQFADEAQGYATSAKASEKKATDAVAGIEQTKADAVQAVQQAQTTAVTAVQEKQTAAEQAVDTAQTSALESIGTARAGALEDVAASTKAAANAATDAAASKEAAAGSASSALNAAAASSTSAGAAATSESNAAASADNANADADRAEAAAKKAEVVVGTDKTLTISGAPADAATVGEALGKKADASQVQDEKGEVRFYSKKEVDDKLDEKLGLHDTADNSKKWAGTTLRLNHNTSDTFIPVFSEVNTIVDYVEKGEIASLNGVAASGRDYIRFTDGTQICWGKVDLVYKEVKDSINITVTFPQPFSDYCVPTFAYHWSWYTEKIYTTGINKTNMDIQGINIQQNDHSFYWIAIGHWK